MNKLPPPPRSNTSGGVEEVVSRNYTDQTETYRPEGMVMNRDLLRPITDDERATYERDGVVCIRGQFDQSWIDRMRTACERDMTAAKGRMAEILDKDGPGRFYFKVFMWQEDHDFRDYAFTSPAPQIAAEVVGLDQVRFFYDQLWIKTPGSSAPTNWHQDLPFWPLLGNHIPSVWLALTPVTRETSGVVYIAGSHKWGKFYRAIAPNGDSRFSDPSHEECPDFHKEFDKSSYNFLSWDMAPGDVLVHHPLAVHGAGGNHSQSQGRIGLSCRYLGGDAVWDPRGNVMPFGGTQHLKSGALPADDEIFPVAWQRAA